MHSKKNSLKELILEKTRELFLTIGFKSVTMDHIANAMGISKKTIYNFETIELKKLITYGVAYPPKVRALLGALLEVMNFDAAGLSVLKKSINPSSSYEYGITPKMLSTANSWNIV